MSRVIYLISALVCAASFKSAAHRSVHRPADPLMPRITTRWLGSTERYTFESYYLEPLVFNKFDQEHVNNHLLPTGAITYRVEKEKEVSGALLSKLIQELVDQVSAHKTEFKNFKILKKRDFNHRTASGVLIVKFKDYPFVVKLFMETPQTFIRPFTKGWQPACFFMMGGGVNRYLTGFTRINNLEAIRGCIQKSDEWRDTIDTPRKWFWIADTCRWFEISSTHIGPTGSYKIEVPCAYATVADAIETDKCLTLFNTEQRRSTIRLCRYLGNRVDPHIDNFMREKYTGQTVIADTELFSSMVGLREPLYFKNYISWYCQLALKCVNDLFVRSKRKSRELQQAPKPELFAQLPRVQAT